MSFEHNTPIVADTNYTHHVDDGNSSDIATIPSSTAHYNIMTIVQSSIASIGIISNFIVVIAFLNDRKLRRKIPNIFIINQVSSYLEKDNWDSH